MIQRTTYIFPAMATTKPRITVTITERQHALLKAISEATGASMSAYISDLLETSEPVMERIASTMQKLQQLNAQRKASVAAALDEAQTALEPVMDAVLGQFDLFASRLEGTVAGGAAATDGAAGCDGARAGAVPIPRPVITGDKPPSKAARVRTKSRVVSDTKPSRKARSRAV